MSLRLLAILLPALVVAQQEGVIHLKPTPCTNWETTAAALTAAQQSWTDPDCYDFQYKFTGFRVGDEDAIQVQVRDGKPVNGSHKTMADFFDMIDTLCVAECPNQGAETCTIEFDAEVGYPTSIYIDMSRFIADEERSYVVSNFVSCPPPQAVQEQPAEGANLQQPDPVEEPVAPNTEDVPSVEQEEPEQAEPQGTVEEPVLPKIEDVNPTEPAPDREPNEETGEVSVEPVQEETVEETEESQHNGQGEVQHGDHADPADVENEQVQETPKKDEVVPPVEQEPREPENTASSPSEESPSGVGVEDNPEAPNDVPQRDNLEEEGVVSPNNEHSDGTAGDESPENSHFIPGDEPLAPVACVDWETTHSDLENALHKWTEPLCYDAAMSMQISRTMTTNIQVRVRDGFVAEGSGMSLRQLMDTIHASCVDKCPSGGAQRCTVEYATEGYPTYVSIHGIEGSRIYEVTDFAEVDCAQPVSSAKRVLLRSLALLCLVILVIVI